MPFLSLSSLPSPLPKQRKKKKSSDWLCVNPLRRPDWLWIPYQHSKGEKLYVPQLLRGRWREMLLRLRILLNSSAPSPPPLAHRGAFFTVFPLSPHSPSRETGSGEACGTQARSPCILHWMLCKGRTATPAVLPGAVNPSRADRAASFCITFNKYLFLRGEIVQIL